MTSLRRRLLLGLGAGLAVCVGGAGFVFDARLGAVLEADFDAELARQGRAVAQSLVAVIRPELQEELNRLGARALTEPAEPGPRARLRAALKAGVRLELAETARRWGAYEPGPGAEYFLVRRGGAEVARSPSLPARHPALDVAAPGALDRTLPDGRPGRVVALPPVAVPLEPERFNEALGRLFPEGLGDVLEARVVVARGRAPLDERVAGLRQAFLGLLGALALAVLLAVAWAVRRGLRPLEDLRRRVEALARAGAGARLDPRGLPAELGPLAEALDRALVAWGAALERESRVSAHVAHELRTPVAELRAAADLAQARPGDPEALGLLAAQAGQIAAQMERIVGAVLRAARAGATAGRPARIAVRPSLERALAERTARAAARGLTLVLAGESLEASADPEAFETVLGVLLDNALAHAPGPGRVTAAVEGRASRVRVAVRNAAPGLVPADLGHLGEPFWRKDAARSGAGEHLGLGLALAASLARSAGLTLGFALEDGDLVATLEAPAAPAMRA